MATIKSFTSLEQSRKLAEILPIESADMVYTMTNGYHTPWVRIEKIDELDKDDVCAWSLAALLNIIKKTIPYEMEYFVDKKVQLTCVLGDKPWELIISDFDNEVDACYEMILKLHEEDLL